MQDIDKQVLDNGRAAALAVPSAEQPLMTLPPGPLRRLLRLHARAEGAILVAQAAQQVAQQAQQAVQGALAEACEEEGVRLPVSEQTPIDIDWRSGEVRLGQAPPMQPQAAMGGPPR